MLHKPAWVHIADHAVDHVTKHLARKEHLSEEEEADTIGAAIVTRIAPITKFVQKRSDLLIRTANNSVWCRPKKDR